MKKIGTATLTFMLGIMVSFVMNIAAETMLSSEQVSYSNSKTSETTVKGNLDELFAAVDINKRLGSTDISSVGDGTVTGAVSAINTNLSGKQATITGGASTIASSNLTASRALVSNSSGKVAVSAVTSTELKYLDGVTSNIQTQLNKKITKDETYLGLSGLSFRKYTDLVLLHVDMIIENFTEHTQIDLGITIPEEYRPYDAVNFPVVAMANNSVQGYGRLRIDNTTGAVYLYLNISGTITHISGEYIYFHND